MKLEISSTLAERLLNEARSSPDVEVCGLLFGTTGRIDAIEPCANVAGQPGDSFEIDPAALFAAHRNMRSGGAALIGYYHSHPNGLVTPSSRDEVASAGDGMVWLIIGNGEIGAWRASQHGGFDPIDLHVVRSA